MESKILNWILGLLTILSFVWSYISEDNRIIAIVIGLILIVFIFISEKSEKIIDLESEQKKLGEKLKIHEQLIEIKKDIEFLKQYGKKK